MSTFYDTVARYYDAEVDDKVDDLMMYSALAEQYGGPIFDVGCGTGRVLLHLAQEGYEVHGIDDSQPMLEMLNKKLDSVPDLAARITAILGDVVQYETDRRYAMVLLSFNALMHFRTQPVQIALLENLASLLADDGLLVIDLPNAGEVFATQDTDALVVDRQLLDPETGNLIMVQSTSYLDRTTQVMQVQWIYDEVDAEDGTVRRMFAPHMLRYFFFPEMKLLLERTGFELVGVYGSTEEDAFEDGSERMILHARKS